MLRRILSPCLLMIFALSMPAVAQEIAKPGSPDSGRAIRANRLQPMRGQRRRLMRIGDGRLDPQNALGLTSEQRDLQRSIRQRHFAATKSQREQLFQLREKRMDGTFAPEDQERVKALRQEIKDSMVGMREESLNLLTPEQRSKLDTLRQERKHRHQEIMNRRQELPRNRPAN
jgi:Spy/CpxP family protein refolding chaperone